jgi:UDP-glucose 4-epimerase
MSIYRGANVLVTGGLGFIGSNLAIRLVREGANVTVIDPLLPGCGGNLRNIAPVAGSIRLVEADISEAPRFRDEIRHANFIFNLAGEVSHIHSMQYPERDLQVNTVSQLRFLLECKETVPGIRIVYAGTRQIYGPPRYLPVDEGHPIRPVDFNGVHKFAATMYHTMLTRIGMLDAIVLRLTNVYGPRMALNVSCQGFLSTYLRSVLLRQRLEIFGDGQQLRDPVFVDDAVEAFLIAGSAQRPGSRTYNVGGPKALSVADIAHTASRLGGCPEPVFTPFPADRKSFDIGSYRTDGSRVKRDLGWMPRIEFEEGFRRTLDFYSAELRHYLDPSNPNPPCRMPEHSGEPHRLTYVKVG